MEVKNKLLALATACAVASSGWILCEEYRRHKVQQKERCDKEHSVEHLSALIDGFEKRIYTLELSDARRTRNERIYSPRDGLDTTVVGWVKDQIQKEMVAKRCR